MINVPWRLLMDADLLVHFGVVSRPLSRAFKNTPCFLSPRLPFLSITLLLILWFPKLGLGSSWVGYYSNPELICYQLLESKQHGLSKLFDFPKACRSRPRSNKYTRCMHKHISYIYIHTGSITAGYVL